MFQVIIDHPYLREDGTDKRLSPKEQKIFDFIALEIEEKNKAPTLKEIQQFFELRNLSCAQLVLTRLRKKGFISSVRHISRSIKILPDESSP